jgi:hypothetical protein
MRMEKVGKKTDKAQNRGGGGSEIMILNYFPSETKPVHALWNDRQMTE